MRKINVKNKREFNKAISEFRNNGYMLITLGKGLAELENDNELVVIDIARA